MRSRDVSGPSGGEGSAFSEVGATAALHGRELLRHGCTVDRVVHDYGDLCQAITGLAFERDVPLEVDEFLILIEVEDSCGGLAPGDAERLFVPFAGGGADRSGLGLSICRRNVAANNGVLAFRTLPGSGCVFTIYLPRHSMPIPSAAADAPIS